MTVNDLTEVDMPAGAIEVFKPLGSPLELRAGFRYIRRRGPDGTSTLTCERIQAAKEDEGDTEDDEDDWCGGLCGQREIVIGCRGSEKAALTDTRLEDAAEPALSADRANPPPETPSHRGALSERPEARVCELEAQVREMAASHAAEVARLQERVEQLERQVVAAQAWPAEHVYDVVTAEGEKARHIRIECPGADEDAVEINGIPNGVRVRIEGSCCEAAGIVRDKYEREFHYDHHAEGFFELRIDECGLENGVLLLVMRSTSPQRMKLWRANGNDTIRASLVPFSEDCSSPRSRGDEISNADAEHLGPRKRPEYFALTPAKTVDSRSVVSDIASSHWIRPPSVHERVDGVVYQPVSVHDRVDGVVR
eukprot:CAMPEP_0117529536 /NCGR_PEP_ID=MMETSP0784-20121206/37882_1 /TAXON_ID=39447 /ORGANISM="" /LENGTH=366 /DNA_ID=CAMNT_0005325859 /DNA_START=86 /DNA_END=1182 /DNA_ORIENTATION=+